MIKKLYLSNLKSFFSKKKSFPFFRDTRARLTCTTMNQVVEFNTQTNLRVNKKNLAVWL
jgi:hypothetical protein